MKYELFSSLMNKIFTLLTSVSKQIRSSVSKMGHLCPIRGQTGLCKYQIRLNPIIDNFSYRRGQKTVPVNTYNKQRYVAHFSPIGHEFAGLATGLAAASLC